MLQIRLEKAFKPDLISPELDASHVDMYLSCHARPPGVVVLGCQQD